MKLEELNAHDQKIVQQVLQYFTHDAVPLCESCEFAHGVSDILAMAAIEEKQGNLVEAEALLKEALQSAVTLFEKLPSIRSFDPNDREQRFEFSDAPAFCDECEKLHPIFDILAAAVLCELKTQEEVEQEFANSIAYVQQFLQK